jgi:hypothetical protein
VQVCIKEYQTLPFFDGIFATVFGQLILWVSESKPDPEQNNRNFPLNFKMKKIS